MNDIERYILDLAETMTKALRAAVESFGDAMPEIVAARERLGVHFVPTLVEAAKVEAAGIMMEYIAARVQGRPTTTMVANAADRALGAVARATLTATEKAPAEG